MNHSESVTNTISANDFPRQLVVRTMVLKVKIKELEAMKRSAPNENKEIINTIINLYQNKKFQILKPRKTWF